jgi:hypothetical protein
MEKVGHGNLPLGWKDLLDAAITKVELKASVSKEACNKAPERDGICLELLKVKWVSIKDDMLALFNQMHLDGRNIKQKHDIVVCIHKTDIPTKLADSRPTTLLQTTKF